MSLAAGTRIGPYEIVSAPGAGGPAFARVLPGSPSFGASTEAKAART
jgi:hypothetical protein